MLPVRRLESNEQIVSYMDTDFAQLNAFEDKKAEPAKSPAQKKREDEERLVTKTV